MKFIDKVAVVVISGSGGRGNVSFRHEKYVDRGGPDGGDGGKGGDVIFKADKNLNTLQKFRYKQKLHAEDGQPGGRRNQHGKNGQDLVVPVPVGTIVMNGEKMLVDLSEPDQEEVIALGGDGGYGNAHFKSSVRQAPRVAEKGEDSQKLEVDLELKLLADVGLVGLPNAGKSTFLSVVSNAKPEIADYPFTTLSPNLGVVDYGKNSLLIADIPGLIEGASEGKGLGDEFLRHIERTSVLLHLIDIYCDDIAKAYETIQSELKNYLIDLSTKPQIVVLTKIDGLDKKTINEQIKVLKKLAGAKTKVVAISSVSGDGVKELIKLVNGYVVKARKQTEVKEEQEKENDMPVYRLDDKQMAWKVEKRAKDFRVSGAKIEKFARRTDFSNEFGVRRLRNIMKKMGVEHELQRSGIKHGDIISFKGVVEIIEY